MLCADTARLFVFSACCCGRESVPPSSGIDVRNIPVCSHAPWAPSSPMQQGAVCFVTVNSHSIYRQSNLVAYVEDVDMVG